MSGFEFDRLPLPVAANLEGTGFEIIPLSLVNLDEVATPPGSPDRTDSGVGIGLIRSMVSREVAEAVRRLSQGLRLGR